VVGCPRSGTTLVRAILNAHPDVAIAPETHFVRRYLIPAPVAPDRLLADLVASTEFADTGLDPDAFRREASLLRDGPAAILLGLMRAFAAARGATVIGEKTPNHLLHMRLLEESFAGARFVHVVRDPRAVVHSLRTVPWSTGSIERDAEMWRRYMIVARTRPPRRPGALHEVRFERLLHRPEATVRALARFVGVGYTPDMLAPEARRDGAGDPEREPWKAGVAGPLEPARSDRWRSGLAPREIRVVEAVAYGEMGRLGYRPVTSARRLLPAAAFTAARRAVRVWRASRVASG
jgi:hypothetical protein